MIRLMEVAGVRFIEAAMQTGRPELIPGGWPVQTYANSVAMVHFGTTEAGLFPEPPSQTASDNECLRIEALTQKALVRLRSDFIADDEELISFFRLRGLDITNDDRKRARSASLFTRLIEAGHLGWLKPCPCPRIERWRQVQMNIGAIITGRPANDMLNADWVARFGYAS